MSDENTSGAADASFALMRRNAALALEVAGISYENRLRLQQLNGQALEDMVRLMQTSAQNVGQAADRAGMVALLGSLSSAHVHIAAQFLANWLGAVASNQQALGACAAKACSDWAADLQVMPGSVQGTGMDAYWANLYTNFSRFLQTLNQASEAPAEAAKPKRRT